MRTTAETATAVSSTATIHPSKESDLHTINEENETRREISVHKGRFLKTEKVNQNQGSTRSGCTPTIEQFSAMNTGDLLSAYSNTVNLNYNGGDTSNSNDSISSNNQTASITPPGVPGVMGAFYNPNASAAANVTSMLQAAGFGQQPSDGLNESTRVLAKELEDFVDRGLQAAMAAERGDPEAPSDEAVAELQLQTARMLRQLLPTNRDLLHLVQEKNWIPLLLGWLNLHDRPAVQVEALLALTNIAELCQQSYYQQSAAAANINLFGSPGTGEKVEDNLQNLQQAVLGSSAPPQGQYMYPPFPGPFDSNPQVGLGPNHSTGCGRGANLGTGSVPQPPFAGGYFPNLMNSMISSPLTASGGDQSEQVQPREQTLGDGDSSCDDSEAIISHANDSSDKQLVSAQPTDGMPTQISSSPKTFHFGNTLQQPYQPAAAPVVPSTSSSFQSGSQVSSDSTQISSSSVGLPPQSAPSFPFSLPPLALPSDSNASMATSPVGPSPLPAGGPMTSAVMSAFNSNFSGPPPSSSFIPAPSSNPAPMIRNLPQPLSASSQQLLRHADAIPTLISLLSSPNREVHEHAMWILGSIAAGESSPPSGANPPGGSVGINQTGNNINGSGGDKSASVSAKEVVLAAGVMAPLLGCLDANPQNLSLQRIGSWALSNLVETKVQQSKVGMGNKSSSIGGSTEQSSNIEINIHMLLPTLRRLLSSSDAEVLSYTCWALSHLCDGPSSNIAAVVTSPDPRDVPGGLVPRLVDLLLHPSWRVTKPALRTIGNIVCAECGEDTNPNKGPIESGDGPSIPTDYTEVILDCDAVPRLKLLISHSNREIQKEACWTLSNIAAGTVDQIQAVIDSEAIPPLVHLVNEKTTDQEVRSEACWVVLNATSCGSDQQIEVLVAEGCVSVLGLLLEETSMVTMALEGLERVLQVEENREVARRTRLATQMKSKSDSDEEFDDRPASPLVSASLIEKALGKNNSNAAASKRAGRIWKQHFVSCALCHQSFSKHRTTDAKFCNECKCYVCSNCDCEIYHLSYQEELWAATEEKNEASKKAKKSKKQKKKEKQKAKKAKQQDVKTVVNSVSTSPLASRSPSEKIKKDSQLLSMARENDAGRSRSSTVTSSSESCSANAPASSGVKGGQPQRNKMPIPISEFDVYTSVGSKKSTVSLENGSSNIATDDIKKAKGAMARTHLASDNKPSSLKEKSKRKKKCSQTKKLVSPSVSEEEEDDGARDEVKRQDVGSDVDFVLYLQQTGSIIALARLMDALDEGNESTGDYDN